MIKFEVLKGFEVVDTVTVSGREVLEGFVPEYLSVSSKEFLEFNLSQTLEDYFLLQLKSMGNALGVTHGTGLTLLSDSEKKLDCGLDEYLHLDAEELEKDDVDYYLEELDRTSAIATWLRSIKSWFKQQSDLEAASKTLTKALFPKLSPEDFATGLEDGMLLVDLLGRTEVVEEGEKFDSERADTPRPDWLKLSFEEAIAYFKAKVPIPVASYKKMADNYHDVAFSVANLTKADLLTDVKWLVERAIADGDSLEVFNRRWDRLITRKGWKIGGNRRKIIYDTNIRSTYGRGREQQMRDPDVLSRRPYWIVRGGDSVTPRPNHMVLNDKAIAADHSFWKVAGTPIWGFSCFPGDTLIECPSGLTRIDQLVVGDSVVGGDGNVHPVTATHFRLHVGYVVELTTKEGGRIKSTPEHRILTDRGWKRAIDIKRGDILVKVVKPLTLNNSVGHVDKGESCSDYSQMPQQVPRTSAATAAFDPDIQVRKEQIDPSAFEVVVELNAESHRFKMNLHQVLNHCGFSLCQHVSGGVLSEEPPAGSILPPSDFGIEDGAIRLELLGSPPSARIIFFCLTLSRMPMQFYIAGKYLLRLLGRRLSSIIVIDPLASNSGSPVPNFDSADFHQLFDGGHSATPAPSYLPDSKELVEVKVSQGFVEGHRLQSLDAGNRLAKSRRNSPTISPRDINILTCQKPLNGGVVDSPFFAEPQDRPPLQKVEVVESAFDGSPLDRFDSIDNFQSWSNSHCENRVVEDISSTYYIGKVYDLSVNLVSSYNLEAATVHNCKHKIFAASEDYLKRNKIEILENPPDPKTVAEPGFRKGLLAKGPERDKILKDAIAKLEPELQELAKESISQPK